jgi:hypothetical protein
LLELNLTNDSFHFQVIPGVVPNRGLNPQPDLSLYGLHYLQRTSDADPKPSKHVHPPGYSTTAGQALHIEPGLFMNVPAALSQTPGSPSMPLTLPPGTERTIVRMGSIPHGATVLMQGPNPGLTPTPGKPNIPHLRPFSTPGNEYPGLSPIPFPGPYASPFPGHPVQPAPTPPGHNPPAVGIQPILATLPASPAPQYLQHVVPEINIHADVLVPNQPPLLGPLPAPILTVGGPISYQSTGPYPEHFQHFINDPNSVLRDAIEDQHILGYIEIKLTTDSLSTTGIPTLGVGSLYETISNIPFLGTANRAPPNPLPAQPASVAVQPKSTPNAFVYSASATFWIEWVRDLDKPPIPLDEGPGEPCLPVRELEPYWEHSTHLQLQYSQLVILIFNGVLWPHVTVATMTLSDG